MAAVNTEAVLGVLAAVYWLPWDKLIGNLRAAVKRTRNFDLVRTGLI